MLSLLYSGQALLPALTLRQKGLVPATSGLSPLRDFHSIEFRPANIPVWLDVSRERLLRAPRPLRLRLRCQREKRCRSKVRQQVSALPPTWFIGFRRARLWPLWFFVFIVVVMRIVWDYINRKGGRFAVVLLLLLFLLHISRQENAITLYTVLVLLRIWRLLIIPAFGEILRQ